MTTRPTTSSASRGFTLVELAAVGATFAVLAAVLLPAFANTARRSESSQCLNNHKQLARAWVLYCADNNDRLPGNLNGGAVQTVTATNQTWCVGWLDFNGGLPTGADTNLGFLKSSELGRYLGSVSALKCPSDQSLSHGRIGDPRVRSVSMNGYVGDTLGPYTLAYTQFKKLSDFTFHGPSQTFVFIDEREDSINDGSFLIDMTGFDPKSPASYAIVDFPASYHNRAASLNFADGRVELHRWVDSRTFPVLRPGQNLPLNVPSPGNPDVDWIQSHCSFKIENPKR